MMVEREQWLTAREFQDAVAATSLLPGPASTQLAIFCARAVAGVRGAILGGLAFIVPGFVLIVLLAELFLAHGRNDAVRGASAGVAAAVVVVIVVAGIGFARGFADVHGALLLRGVLYAVAGAAATVSLGPWVLAVLLGSGIVEVALRLRKPAALVWLGSTAKIPALIWTAFKVGGLSFGGGLVIIPLMQHDVVHSHHWLTERQFADAVALGSSRRPRSAHGQRGRLRRLGRRGRSPRRGGRLRALVRVRPRRRATYFPGSCARGPGPRAFLDGAGPAAVGAIFGAAALLAPQAWKEWWQPLVVLAAVVAALLGRSSFFVLLLGLALGLLAAAAGASAAALTCDFLALAGSDAAATGR